MPRPAPRVAPATRATLPLQRHRPLPPSDFEYPKKCALAVAGPGEARFAAGRPGTPAGAVPVGRSRTPRLTELGHTGSGRRTCGRARHALGRLPSHGKPSERMRYPLFLVRQLSRTLSKKLVRTGARHLPFVPKERTRRPRALAARPRGLAQAAPGRRRRGLVRQERADLAARAALPRLSAAARPRRARGDRVRQSAFPGRRRAQDHVHPRQLRQRLHRASRLPRPISTTRKWCSWRATRATSPCRNTSSGSIA